jgi:hypothetical protein
MRIATWNIDRCRPGSRLAIEHQIVMTGIEADVWVLTETYRSLSPGPDYELISSSIDAPDRDATKGECWVALWSRFPAKPIQLTVDPEQHAAMSVSGTVIVGTVLPWPSDQRDHPVSGKAAFLARLTSQAAEWKRLRDEHPALCVTGDINQDLLSDGRPYCGSYDGRAALRAALRNARLDCLTGDEDDPLKVAPDLACLDHICVGGLRAKGKTRSTAWPEPGSLSLPLTYHYGVWSDVELVEPIA